MRAILERVDDITSGERQRDYGRPLINHIRIALSWTKILRFVVTPDTVVRMMIQLKWERHTNQPKHDNLVDIIGYTVCLDDMANNVLELGYADDYDQALGYLNGMSVTEMERVLTVLNIEEELGERLPPTVYQVHQARMEG